MVEHIEMARGRTAWNRAGSSWNKPNSSAWRVGAKDPQQRLRSRKVMNGDFAGMKYFGEDHEAGDEDSNNSHSAGAPDEPQVELDVQKEGGAFRIKGSVETVVDPDTLYNIITDYDSNARVFRNVHRVEVEQKGEEKVVTQYCRWNFLMLSGNYDVKMRMKDDPQNRTISYELERPGFLKVFNGSWTVESLTTEGASSQASRLVVNQRALPSFFPSGPLAVGAGSYAQNIMANQMKTLLTDLATEASQIKENSSPAASGA